MSKKIKESLTSAVFFLGWVLSPFTFWNDAFVNIPISYICANLFIRIFPIDFLPAIIIFYWITNFLGLFMMYISGKNVMEGERPEARGKLVKLVITCLIYTVLLALLYKFGILKPFLKQ